MRRVLVVLCVLMVLLAAGIATLLANSQSVVDVPLEIAKGLINLFVAVAVTGVLAYLLSQRGQAQARHEEKVNLLTEALQGLKAAYERVVMARFFLAAHPSAKTFNEQIRAIAQARTELQRVQRERHILGTRLDTVAQAMLDYLSDVALEYRDNYPLIAVGALREEQMMDRARRGESVDLSETHLIPGDGFAKLATFVDDEQWKCSTFHTSYREAKRLLQDQIKA